MYYKISRKQYNAMGANEEEILSEINSRLGHPDIKQDSIVAVDRVTGAKLRIKTNPIRVITKLIIN